MPENRIITVKYSSNGYTKTRAAYQYDYGQVLRLEGFPEGMLPDPFEVHFSVGNGLAKTQIGTDSAVSVLDECLERYGTIAAWLFLHDTASDGETKYTIEIPVRSRSKTVDAPPTPVQQSAITQAIAALGRGVDAAEAAQAAAEAAANSVRNASATAEHSLQDQQQRSRCGILTGRKCSVSVFRRASRVIPESVSLARY